MRSCSGFALALYKTDSNVLVETFMFNHAHLMIETRDPIGFMHAFRQPYSKFFNCKYHRAGLLGEEKHFLLETVGLYHKLAAASYVLRNALHYKVMDEKNRVVSRAIYNVLGIDKDGHKDLLGMYVSKSEGVFRKKWTMPVPNWGIISQQLAIKFEDRYNLL